MAVHTRPRGIVKHPKVSVNKLGEYLEAHSTRRRKIVESAKYPDTFIITMYDKARDIAVSYITGKIDRSILESEIEALQTKSIAAAKLPGGKNKALEYKNSAQALSMLMATSIRLKGWDIQPYTGKKKYLFINGVSISVHPDLIIKKKTINGTAVGAIKLHIIKNNSLSDKSQEVVALMIHEYLIEYVIQPAMNEFASKKHCLSHDIFAEQFECCPGSSKTLMKKIEIACEEIAMWWDRV